MNICVLIDRLNKKIAQKANITHTHPYADPAHTHPYAAEAHTHPYADQTHTHPYAAEAHTHPYAALVHSHQRIVGEIVLWPSDAIPGGWLACAGQAVSRSTYLALYTMIGTTYGAGDGSSTFNIPDLRGRFALGQDDMGGSSANRVTSTQADNLGQGAGAESHTLTESEMPSHQHTVYGILTNAIAGTSSRGTVLNSNNNTISAPAGGGGTHNNMPPYLTLNYIIYAGQ